MARAQTQAGPPTDDGSTGGRAAPAWWTWAWWTWAWGPGRLRRWRRLVLRRLLAVVCAGGAVVGVLAVARAPQHGATRPVVVTTRSVAVGQVVDPRAVRVARWPAGLVPVNALGELGEAVGRRAGAAMGAGEPVTTTRLSPSGLLAGQPTGTVAVHVALADSASVSMVDAGERVDLLDPEGPVARGLIVLRVDRPAPADGLGGMGSSADVGAGMVVAADAGTAAALAAAPLDALGRPSLTVVLRAG